MTLSTAMCDPRATDTCDARTLKTALLQPLSTRDTASFIISQLVDQFSVVSESLF